MEHDLYKSLGDVDMCREFDIFKVKVPIIFFGTVGFSPHRDRRYKRAYELHYFLDYDSLKAQWEAWGSSRGYSIELIE